MKDTPDFVVDVMASSYMDPTNGKEGLLTIVRRWKPPFSYQMMMHHMKKHQPRDLTKAEMAMAMKGVPMVRDAMQTDDSHKRGLDEFIAIGRRKLLSGQMQITAENYLKAVKIKLDDEKANKDRVVEAVKVMKGASGIAED